jgi:hypothetical protein
LKLIVSVPYAPDDCADTSELMLALLLAEVIASRKVTKPSTAMLSPVPVTVMVAAKAFAAVDKAAAINGKRKARTLIGGSRRFEVAPISRDFAEHKASSVPDTHSLVGIDRPDRRILVR